MKIIGVDLGGTKVKAGLIEDNKLKKVFSKEINSSGKMMEVLKEIEETINSVFDESVQAIGIGVPSIVDLKKGIVFEVTNITSWKKVPLKKFLERKYMVPVFINNDAKCFVLGEKYFGNVKKYDNVVGITIGTGVGGGIIINGKLYPGTNCGAGEFCNILYKDKNLEEYSSGMLYKSLNVKGKELSQLARKRDKKALEIFNEQGYHIGKLLSAVVNSLDPQAIVLGGSIINDYKFWKKSMRKSLKESVYKRSFSRLKIKLSTNKDIAILGAASLCLDYLKEARK